MELSRRDLLKLGVLGGAAMYLPLQRVARTADFASLTTLPRPYTLPFKRPDDIDLRASVNGGSPVNYLEMRMRERTVPLLGAGKAETPLWVYEGPDGQINPTIHVDKGQPVNIHFENDLPDTHPIHGYESWTSVHLHGSASLPQYDGYANDITKPGQSKVYKYPNAQSARTLWYHDHGVHRTSQNAYSGLAGQYHLHDQKEKDWGLPQGKYDIPLTIRDALFAQNSSLLWNDNDHSSLMGDVILVNGVPWPYLDVNRRRYRFRMLNASISRSFNLSLSDSRAKMHVIATDGGYLTNPVGVTSFRFGMAERYEIIIDFTNVPPGVNVQLVSGEVKNNVDYLHTRKVMQFRVKPWPYTDGLPRPEDLVYNNLPPVGANPAQTPSTGGDYISAQEVMGLTATMAGNRRRLIEFKKSDLTNEWLIGDHTWNDIMASNYQRVVANPAANSIEMWEFKNNSGGWFHPVHVHLVDFKILSRNGVAPRSYEQGPKDVVYVGEGETVRVVAKFGPHQGRYMIHCHNLVHEDHDMMSQFRVGPAVSPDPNDPIDAAPAQD